MAQSNTSWQTWTLALMTAIAGYFAIENLNTGDKRYKEFSEEIRKIKRTQIRIMQYMKMPIEHDLLDDVTDNGQHGSVPDKVFYGAAMLPEPLRVRN